MVLNFLHNNIKFCAAPLTPRYYLEYKRYTSVITSFMDMNNFIGGKKPKMKV